MKVLMTGATGFIGGELLEYLLQKHEVYALVRADAFDAARLPKDLNTIQADLLDSDLSGKLNGVEPEVIVHLASFTPVRFSFKRAVEYGRVNYLGTVNLVEAARKMPSLVQFVHASTMEAYRAEPVTITEDDPLEGGTPYGVSKAAADLYVQAAGRSWNLPYTIMRCGNTFGRTSGLPEEARGYLVEKAVISMLADKDVEFDGAPDRIRSWLYYPDHISAYLSVIGVDRALYRAYNVSGEAHSVGEVVQMVRRLTGFRGKIAWGVNPRPYDPKSLVTSSERIRSELGWRPRYTVEEGLKKVVEYWKDVLVRA